MEQLDLNYIENKHCLAKGYKLFYADGSTPHYKYCEDLNLTVWHEDGELVLCRQGIHFCLNPVDCLSYIDVNKDMKLMLVEAYDNLIVDEDKCVCSTLLIKHEVHMDNIPSKKVESSGIVQGSKEVYGSDNVLNSIYINGGKEVNYSSFVNYSKRIENSIEVDSSMSVQNSKHVSCGKEVDNSIHCFRSFGVHKSDHIQQCEGITSSSYCENSDCVYDSQNISCCKYILHSHDLTCCSHMIFCKNLHNKNFYFFNLPVSAARLSQLINIDANLYYQYPEYDSKLFYDLYIFGKIVLLKNNTYVVDDGSYYGEIEQYCDKDKWYDFCDRRSILLNQNEKQLVHSTEEIMPTINHPVYVITNGQIQIGIYTSDHKWFNLYDNNTIYEKVDYWMEIPPELFQYIF